ncbi:MAG: hypothetical protein HWN66_10825 [Candidatus Helarchaeota archaeon]|nr:hypothetical protein [Candidatus Helarchaeota archaeon]
MKDIKKLEIEAYIQATEDSEKVFTAIRNIIPPEIRDDENKFITNNVRGVYHNPITIVRVKYLQKARQIVEYIAKLLSESDKKYLFQTMKRRIDKGNLYLRFGKQELYQNKLMIKEIQDMVKLRIGFSSRYSTQEKMTETLRKIGLIKA